VKRPLLEKAVEASSVFAPAKMPVLEIEDVNTMWFVRPRGRDSEESPSLSTQGSNIEDDDEKRVLPARCPICDGCDAGR
jgi:hypothetical protein